MRSAARRTARTEEVFAVVGDDAFGRKTLIVFHADVVYAVKTAGLRDLTDWRPFQTPTFRRESLAVVHVNRVPPAET
jgi:hypothetical protein